MITIITPCCRQKNIPHLYDSIDFDKIHKWIIIYDTSNDKKYDKIYNHSKILEVECTGGISGNPQRNYGISLIDDGYIYFLDDDNIIHPNFWEIVPLLDNNCFYTFNQFRTNEIGNVLPGNNVNVDRIDTAMFIVHKKHINDVKWICDKYNADGYFISEINKNNIGAHRYINAICCYYNYLI